MSRVIETQAALALPFFIVIVLQAASRYVSGMTSRTRTKKTTPTADAQIIYEGKRSAAVTGGDVAVTRRTHNASGTATMARPVSLRVRLDLRNHSPTGFEWGYGGSGPAQLALALLADALGDDEQALLLYQAFKWKVIANLPEAGWQMSAAQIKQIAGELQAEQGTKAQAQQSGPVFTLAL